MPRFDLEQVAHMLCDDRAFGNVALNELIVRLDKPEQEPSPLPFAFRPVKKKFTAEQPVAFAVFYTWFLRWFGQYTQTDHNRNVQYLLMMMSLSHQAQGSSSPEIKKDQVFYDLADRLQTECSELGMHSEAEGLADYLRAEWKRGDLNPYEVLGRTYDELFHDKRGLKFYAEVGRGQVDWDVPIECKSGGFVERCVYHLQEHIKAGGRMRPGPKRIYDASKEDWFELKGQDPKGLCVVLSPEYQAGETEPAMETPKDFFRASPWVTNISKRRTNDLSARNPWDPNGAYQDIGILVTECFFLSNIHEHVTVAFLAKRCQEMGEGGNIARSKQIIRDHFKSAENPQTSWDASQSGSEPFPWDMHGWAAENAMSVTNTKCIYAILKAAPQDTLTAALLSGDAEPPPPPLPPSRKRRDHEVEEEDGAEVHSTIGGQLRATEAEMEASKFRHLGLKRTEVDLPGFDTTEDEPRPNDGEPEFEPDDPLSGYAVAAGLLVGVGALFWLSSNGPGAA